MSMPEGLNEEVVTSKTVMKEGEWIGMGEMEEKLQRGSDICDRCGVTTPRPRAFVFCSP